MAISRACEVCGKAFLVSPNRAETAKTCSRACRGVLDRKKYAESRPVHGCPQCGQQFESPPSHAHRRTYCSKACADEAKLGVEFQMTPDGVTILHTDGYVLERAWKHPFAVSRYVMQHRLVMEQWMREVVPDHPFLVEIEGVKYLSREIDIHHKNEVKADNQRENLVACTNAAHRDLHDGRVPMRGEVWPESGNEIPAEARSLERTCKYCGKSFRTKRASARRGGGIYCCRLCADRGRVGSKRKSRT